MKTLFSFLLMFIFIQLTAQNSVELIGKIDPVYPFTGINSSRFGEFTEVLGDVNGDDYDDWAIACDVSANYVTGAFQTKIYIYLGSDSIKANQPPNLTIASNDHLKQSGNKLAAAGDFNHDGFMDFAACYENYVAIFFGRKHLSQVPDLIIKEEELGIDLNGNISSVGDVNHDDYDDILISSGKKVVLVFGNNNFNTNENISFQINEDENYYMTSKGIGDINGDGFDDMVIANEKEIHFYLGGTNLNTAPDFIIQNNKSVDDRYLDIQANFDYNNDGFDDFAIKNGQYDSDSIYRKIYHLFSGKNFPYNQPDFELNKSQLKAIGDINKDGFDDLILGMRSYDLEMLYGGKVLTSKKIFTKDDFRDYYGWSDFNNDGNVDILAANDNSYKYGSYTGLVSLFLNCNTDTLRSDLFFHGAVGTLAFGTSVSGDFNGDGINDILIRHGWDNIKYQLFLGGKDIQPIPSMEITSDNNPRLSFNFDMSGDVNGDGFADIIASNYYSNYFQVFYGNSTLNNKSDAFITNNAQWFGCSLSNGGDFNGDGYDDIIVGAYRAEANGIRTGQAFLYSGGSKIDTIPSLIFTGETNGEQFGNVVKFVGDLNNDGFDDLAIGADRYERDDFPYYGRVYIYFGSSNPDNQPDLIFEPEQSPLFNISRASAGDVNNDGFDDLLIGAPYNGNGMGSSYVYLFYGGSNMDILPDIEIKKSYAWLDFGVNLCSAGDLNHDGFDDILISGGEGENVSIYFGGTIMDNEADYIIENTNKNRDGFGYEFSLLGDINADRKTEIIVGAPYSNACGLSTGRCFIYSLNFKNDQSAIKKVYNLYHYTNQETNEITIGYKLNQSSNVEINLYNINGILVEKISNSFQIGGQHQLIWNPKTNLPGI